MRLRTSIVLLALILCAVPARAQDDESVRLFLQRIEGVVKTGDTVGYLALAGASADRERARDFAGSELMPGATRSVLQERDRLPLGGAFIGNGYRLMVDVMSEFGSRAHIATWRLDITRTGT